MTSVTVCARPDMRGAASPSPVPAEAAPPLCVALDGTLVTTDTAQESLCALMRRWPVLARLPGWLLRGRAHAKARLAEEAGLDAALLPYDERVLAFLRAEKAGGRRLVLASTADRRIAEAVAAHLGLFDEVIAPDGLRDPQGWALAEALRARFGDGFAYAGSGGGDLPVWETAGAAVLVNAPAGVVRAVERLTRVEAVLGRRRPWLPALLRALRPHQWVKNTLVFVPALAAGALFDLPAHANAVLTFLAFCCTASAIYLINDLTDLEADRRHPHKRARPFASGALPIGHGVAAVPLLLGAGAALAGSAGALGVLVLYAAASLLYSLKLKSYPLVDIFMLASLYSIRLFAGGEATGYGVSMWLLAFSSFLFFSLATVKRVAELAGRPQDASERVSGRGYFPADFGILQLMGVSASFVSAAVLALYVQQDLVAPRPEGVHPVWAIVPLTLFWQCRIWLATARGWMLDDPIVFAAKDWVSWLVGISAVAIVAAAHVAPGMGW